MQVCTLLQTDNHASTPPLSFFTGRMPFLPPNQQRQSTEGSSTEGSEYIIYVEKCGYKMYMIICNFNNKNSEIFMRPITNKTPLTATDFILVYRLQVQYEQ